MPPKIRPKPLLDFTTLSPVLRARFYHMAHPVLLFVVLREMEGAKKDFENMNKSAQIAEMAVFVQVKFFTDTSMTRVWLEFGGIKVDLPLPIRHWNVSHFRWLDVQSLSIVGNIDHREALDPEGYAALLELVKSWNPSKLLFHKLHLSLNNFRSILSEHLTELSYFGGIVVPIPLKELFRALPNLKKIAWCEKLAVPFDMAAFDECKQLEFLQLTEVYGDFHIAHQLRELPTMLNNPNAQIKITVYTTGEKTGPAGLPKTINMPTRAEQLKDQVINLKIRGPVPVCCIEIETYAPWPLQAEFYESYSIRHDRLNGWRVYRALPTGNADASRDFHLAFEI